MSSTPWGISSLPELGPAGTITFLAYTPRGMYTMVLQYPRGHLLEPLPILTLERPLMTESPTATVDPNSLHESIDSGGPVRIVDVRTPGEFESVHIPGAYNVPLDLLREHRDEFCAHLDENVVLVCRSGQRAGQAEQALREAGLPNLHILEGGMLGWESAGLPVNRGADRWDLERQVRLVAGSLVLGSVLGSIAVPKLKWLAAGIGGGLTFAALSDTCAMGMLLSKLPYNRGAQWDLQNVVTQLTGGPSCPAERKLAWSR